MVKAWGGYSLKWPIQGGSAPKGVPFSGFRYIKGYGFHKFRYMKGWEYISAAK